MGNEKHLMVDIEALSTEPNGLITTVGCVLFNIDTGVILKVKEYNLSWQDQLGRDIKKDTLCWWFKQSVEAQNSITSKENEVSVAQFYQDFKEEFCSNITKAWAKSPGFDYGMIDNLFKNKGMLSPIPFRKIADCRDLYYIAKKFKIELPDKGERLAHNALSDALGQTEDTCVIFKRLREAIANG